MLGCSKTSKGICTLLCMGRHTARVRGTRFSIVFREFVTETCVPIRIAWFCFDSFQPACDFEGREDPFNIRRVKVHRVSNAVLTFQRDMIRATTRCRSSRTRASCFSVSFQWTVNLLASLSTALRSEAESRRRRFVQLKDEYARSDRTCPAQSMHNSWNYVQHSSFRSRRITRFSE